MFSKQPTEGHDCISWGNVVPMAFLHAISFRDNPHVQFNYPSLRYCMYQA